MRDLMCLLAEHKLGGAACITFDSVDALIQHQTDALESSLAILDVNLGTGKPSGLDAFNWLREHHFKGKIYFLTGHAHSHPLVVKACETGAGVWAKPVASDFIISSIKNILNEGERH